MRLYALLEGNAETELEDREITGITNDSRNVEDICLSVSKENTLTDTQRLRKCWQKVQQPWLLNEIWA